ncbi:MAG TPA: hypothetical protein DHV26_17275 [Cytophagales bacterium]|nr:hypothetical protein [Cytophagales bacterium]
MVAVTANAADGASSTEIITEVAETVPVQFTSDTDTSVYVVAVVGLTAIVAGLVADAAANVVTPSEYS